MEDDQEKHTQNDKAGMPQEEEERKYHNMYAGSDDFSVAVINSSRDSYKEKGGANLKGSRGFIAGTGVE